MTLRVTVATWGSDARRRAQSVVAAVKIVPPAVKTPRVAARGPGIGSRAAKRLEARDLVGLLADVHLGKDQAGGVVECGEQVDLPVVRPGRAAQALAVDGQTAQPCGPGRLRAAVREPAPDRPVQCVTVDAGQQPADRGLGGQGPPGQKRIGAGADLFEHVRRGVGDPLSDREQRRRSGQHRARGECEHDGQAVAHAAWITRVRNLGQPFQQARDLLGSGLRLLAQLVKGRRDQR